MKTLFSFLLVIIFFVSCSDEVQVEDSSEFSENILFQTPSNTVIDVGKYVLSPSKANYDSLLANGIENVIFVYYPRNFIKSEKDFLYLKEFGDTIEMPKSITIPLPDSQMVSKGDVVLTWWQNGTGMQRALVLSKEPTYTPTVYYLDNQYYFYYSDNDPLFWIDTLMPSSFLKIEDKLMPGRSCSITGKYVSSFYTIINSLGYKLVVMSWSGDLQIVSTKECEIVPMNTTFEVGDSVSVPYLGTYTNGTVKTVYDDIGKMMVKINFIDTTMVIKATIFDSFKIER